MALGAGNETLEADCQRQLRRDMAKKHQPTTATLDSQYPLADKAGTEEIRMIDPFYRGLAYGLVLAAAIWVVLLYLSYLG
jgi:hypothetical protein